MGLYGGGGGGIKKYGFNKEGGKEKHIKNLV